MRLIELLKLANKGYPDGVLADYFDEQTGEPRRGGGDALALFVVGELAGTFDADATDGEQLAEAARVMERARARLAGVITSLDGAPPPRAPRASRIRLVRAPREDDADGARAPRTVGLRAPRDGRAARLRQAALQGVDHVG